MNTHKIQQKARKNNYTLLKKHQEREKVLNNLTTEIDRLENMMGVSSDVKAKNGIKKIIPVINHEKSLLKHYQNYLNNTKSIVITNWSENDIYDSNNQVIDNEKLSTWKHLGVKVYGMITPQTSTETNSQDNKGFFANFNYPINIVENPDIYYFDQQDLSNLYRSIAAHNPKLGSLLVKIAKAGTIPVHTFKTAFGLADKQIKARIAKMRAEEANNIPDPNINKLRKYYQWELKYRKKYDNQADLSQYDSDENSDDTFASDLENYKLEGNEDSDDQEYDDDNLDGDWTSSDYNAGEEYTDPYYSQWSDNGSDYGMYNDD